MPISENAERVTATLPSDRIPALEERAALEGLRRPEWIRKTLLAAIDGEATEPAEATNPPDEKAFEVLAEWLERRFRALEIRATHNRNACLFVLGMVHQEAITAGNFAKAAATSNPPDDADSVRLHIEMSHRETQERLDQEGDRARTRVRQLQADGDQEASRVSGSVDELLALLRDQDS